MGPNECRHLLFQHLFDVRPIMMSLHLHGHDGISTNFYLPGVSWDSRSVDQSIVTIYNSPGGMRSPRFKSSMRESE